MPSKSNRPAFFATSALLVSALCIVAAAKTIYVDDDAIGSNNGSSWTDAYTFLQDALADAKLAEKPVEIRVAQGTYKPNQGLAAIPEFDWRTATFQLISGVTLKGGYAGSGASDPNVRNTQTYETILSGDLDGNDVVNDAQSLYWEQTRRDNSYHVMTAIDTRETASVNGFTITGGSGGSWSTEDGGGMNILTSSVNVANCKFTNCSGLSGGAIYSGYSKVTVIDCTFSNNLAFTGAGMYNVHGNLMLSGCVFHGNFQTVELWYPMIDIYTAPGGGGMRNVSSHLTLIDCVFTGNTGEQGGGLSNRNSDLMLVNCLITGNLASCNWLPSVSYAGGIRNDDSSAILTNCTFSGNSAPHTGAISGDSVMTNCIVWGNAPDQIADKAYVSYSDVQGGWDGEGAGNIDADPLFAEPGYWADVDDPNVVVEPNDPNAVWVDGDYHLKSEAGRWDPNGGNWVSDDVTSPCVDAADPNSDWTSETWPHGGRVNMGAYGGTREASMSPQPEEMSLPYVAYIHEHDTEAAKSFRSLLVSYGCSTTLIGLDNVAITPLDSYDLVIVGNETGMLSSWGESDSVAAIDNSGKPILGLGEGGYAFFGKLGLEIGWPNGMHGSRDSIEVIDPNNSLFSVPYAIDVPDDRVLQLYTETEHVDLYLWPMPETVTALGRQVESHGYYPLALEHDRYVLWGFTESTDNMTQLGKDLFINVVIRAANVAW